MEYSTPSEAYLAVARSLLERGETVSPRGDVTRELLFHEFGVSDPTEGPLLTCSDERNRVLAEYLAKEFALYMDGTRDAARWAVEASKFWERLKNPDGTINSNYGYIVFHERNEHGFTPWEWAKRSLQIDPFTRQAFMTINSPRYQYVGNGDQPCTMHVWFVHRDGVLSCRVVMRSCDLVKGLAYDMPWFVYLLRRMAAELQLEVGSYRHCTHSMHFYERDLRLVQEMVGC